MVPPGRYWRASRAVNLAEEHGRFGRYRMHLWRVAYASAEEVDSHLTLLARAGVVDGIKPEQAIETFDEVCAMMWQLLNPKS
jgi:hypothetical protein